MRVGTDCSGIDAPIQALRNLGISHDHIFSTDRDPLCGETIRANFQPRCLTVGPEADITRRDPAHVESVDLYVCGFPCQPFSKLGGRLGFEDPRGTVFFGCLEYIRTHRPKHYVLENVKTLLTIDEGRTWNHILNLLNAVGGYQVSHQIMDTKDYGIPQSRRRLYIIGVRRDDPDEPLFSFPPPLALGSSPLDYVVHDPTQLDRDIVDEARGSQRDTALSLTPLLTARGSVFVDILQYRSESRIPLRGFPHATCLLCTSYVWCTPESRWAAPQELLSLQGFPTDFVIPIGHHKFRKQIGNAMSVNVLEHLFATLFHVPRPTAPVGPYTTLSRPRRHS